MPNMETESQINHSQAFTFFSIGMPISLPTALIAFMYLLIALSPHSCFEYFLKFSYTDTLPSGNTRAAIPNSRRTVSVALAA